MAAADKNWAEKYINDPLTAPDPVDETGPGTHFHRQPEVTKSSIPTTPPRSPASSRLSSNNPFRNHGSPKETTSSSTQELYPSPPPSASPRGSPHHRREVSGPRSRPVSSSSLREKFPGDLSAHPLEQISKEKAKADRSRHVTKKHAVLPDTIDQLDKSGMGSYHHEGPYDATLFARNNSFGSSPVAAVSSTNAETLRATPHERVVDSVMGHRPLDGVAEYPPGTRDANGRMYNYEQGENMMIDLNPGGGAYKRWPGLEYHPDDIKGKGEPSYTIEKALKNEKHSEKSAHGGVQGIEMTSGKAMKKEALGEDTGLARSGSLTNTVKKRVGSLKKKFHDHDE